MVFTRYSGMMLLPVLLIALGCSGGVNDPLGTPETIEPYATSAIDEISDPQRVLWGLWRIHFDLNELTSEVEPLRRTQAHYNITDFVLPPVCYDCLEIDVKSFDPVTRLLKAKVQLANKTKLNPCDVRGILYTNDYGHKLLNADGWTNIWDISGGMDINPFKAFAIEQGSHMFYAGAKYTRDYRVYIPKPPMYAAITFAVDASWPDNCKEPYQIENLTSETILDTVGSTGIVYVDVHDWQGDVDGVALSAPEISGQEFVPFTHLSDDTWAVELTNVTGAEAGEYEVMVRATSADGGSIFLYQFFKLTVYGSNTPIDPVDVTPPWLNFCPQDVCIDGDYAYVAGNITGLHIFDISDPFNPFWVDKIDTPFNAYCVQVSDGYAYMTNYFYMFYVMDIDPIASAHVVSEVNLFAPMPGELAVSGGFAYVCTDYNLSIIDVDPPESAYEVGGYITSGKAEDVEIVGGYAYVATNSYSHIIDVSDPGAPELVAQFGYHSKGIAVSGDYAYITSQDHFEIYNIDQPISTYQVNSIDMPGYCYDVAVSGGYAYVTFEDTGLLVVDVDPPESAFIAGTVATPGPARKVSIDGSFAYVVDLQSGLQVIDIDLPEGAYIAKSINTIGEAWDVAVLGDMVYVAAGFSGLKAISVEDPEFPEVVGVVKTPGRTYAIAVDSEYAYMADYGDNLLVIIDINPIESAGIVKELVSEVSPEELALHSGYVYLGGVNFEGMEIFDVEPVESAHLVGLAEGIECVFGLDIADDYAYVLDIPLKLVDITVPESAHVEYSADCFGYDIDLGDGVAYMVDDFYNNLNILDTSEPASVHVISHLELSGQPMGVEYVNGYAYVASGLEGLQVVDVEPPESAHVYSSVDTVDCAFKVVVSDNYAFVADRSGGLRIIKLW